MAKIFKKRSMCLKTDQSLPPAAQLTTGQAHPSTTFAARSVHERAASLGGAGQASGEDNKNGRKVDNRVSRKRASPTQLCEALAKEAKTDQETTSRVLAALPCVVGSLLRDADTVRLHSLCTFIRKEKKAREAGTKIICGREVALKPKPATVTVRAAVHHSLKQL